MIRLSNQPNEIQNPSNLRGLPLDGGGQRHGPLSDAVKSKFQLSFFVATLMPFYVFIAFVIFSLPGGPLGAWICEGKGRLLGIGLTTLAKGAPTLKNPTPRQRSLNGPMKVCRS